MPENSFCGLTLRKQIENIPKHAAVSLVEFGVFTALAGDMSKPFVLDIEEFAEKAACGTDLACFVGSISAFGADEMNIFTHFMASLFFFR